MERSEWSILNAEPDAYSAQARKYLEKFATVTELPTSQDQLTQHLRGHQALIVRLGLQVNRQVLSNAPDLQVVVSATTGTDHIDLQAAADQGVEVLTLKGETEFLDTIPSTAEHTWALLLAVTRNIVDAHYQIMQGGWDRQKLRGHNLKHKKLGILGLGRVGCQVATIAQAFQMQVGAFDIDATRSLPQVTNFPKLKDMLAWCDILSIHIPLDESTVNMLDYHQLSQLSKGAVVVNTSRAGVWNEQAVVHLLQQGHLQAVATDVLSHERDLVKRKQSPFFKYKGNNLLITPHIAGATFESMESTEVFMAKKLEKFFKTLHSKP